MPDIDFSALRHTRATRPDAVAEALASRVRRDLLAGDGKLMIIAADHPGRRALGAGTNSGAMADREELIRRLALALDKPGVDGVLATPDIIDDLALLGMLDNKIVVGSMNRGGLRGATFEMDDRFGAYTIDSIAAAKLDFAKTLTRINLSDPGTLTTLMATAEAVNQAVEAGVPIMLEPFMSEWVDGAVRNVLTAEAVIESIAIVSALGGSSAYTWLKIPAVPDMEEVARSTTLPILILGGDSADGSPAPYEQWRAALALPGVRGLVVGRSLLYPSDGDYEAAIDHAVNIVHGNNP